MAPNLTSLEDIFKTLKAEREAQISDPAAAPDPEAYGRMRRVLSWHPSVGRLLARVAYLSTTRKYRRDNALWLDNSSQFLRLDEVSKALASLRADGYYVFQTQAAPALVKELREFASTTPCSPRPVTGTKTVYPGAQATAGRYDFSEDAILSCSAAQDWATDPLAVYLASTYLGLPAILDLVAMWWTTAADPAGRDGNAQVFHTDRDRLAFVKFFVYLSDVDAESGPHVYVPGSHRTLPRRLRSDRRFTDEEVTGMLEPEQARLRPPVEITGPAGTVFVADTRGLHKGKPPASGDRLVLQSEFASSLLGAPFNTPTVFPTGISVSRLQNDNRTFRRWDIRATN